MRHIKGYGAGKVCGLLKFLLGRPPAVAAVLEGRVQDQRAADPGHGAAIIGRAGALHLTTSPRPPWLPRKAGLGRPASPSRWHACRRAENAHPAAEALRNCRTT